MADEKPPSVKPVTPKPSAPKPQPETDYAHVPMSEDFSKAKWTLPPVGIVAIAIAGVAVVLAIVLWTTSPKPGAAGSIDDMGVVQTDPSSVMVAMQLSLTNTTTKPFWVKTVTAKLQADKEYTDTAASASDFERYFNAFPDLKQHATAEPLRPETRILPGVTIRGSVIFSFPISKDAFDQRKSLSVSVQPYDQPRSVVITK